MMPPTRAIGVRLHSLGEKHVLQVRTHGFTLSRMEPYETWDRLLSEARRLWDFYRQGLDVEAVLRVASRFINNLKLPMKAGQPFQDYLTRPPDVPDGLPQGVLSFMQRVVLLDPELDLRANVIQLLQEGPRVADHVPVILDIDVYKDVDLQPDTEDLWTLLAKLRTFKNAIFFASLTEKAVELFE